MFILIIVLCILVSVVASLFSKSGLVSILAAVAGGVWGAVDVYYLFPTVGFYYTGIWLTLLIAGLMGAGLGKMLEGNDMGFAIPIIIFAAVIVIAFFSDAEILHADRYKNLIGNVEVKEFTDDNPMVDSKAIRLVSKETALSLARKVLGQSKGNSILGSQLQLDEDSMAIQEVQGDLYWIVPLDFGGFFRWWNIRTIPGYVRVSAIDPNRPAQLVDSDPKTGKEFKINYTPKAYFGSWLQRKVYFEYAGIAREEFTFEVDDNWKPYYTISAVYPSIGFSGYKTKGVILFDPQTGEMELKEVDQIPSWVDRVVPLDQALQQSKWWGKYVHGWLNWSDKDKQKPTGDDMWFVRQGDKRFWFSGMTSVSSKDHSLVGAMMVSTRTGEAVYYHSQGADEDGVMNAVNSSLGADGTKWHAVQPIPYNIYGQMTWVCPVISNETSMFQKVAIVEANNINILAIDENLEKALQKYRIALSQKGNEIAPMARTSLRHIGPVAVERVGDLVIDGTKIFLVYLKGYPEKVFSATGETEQTLPIALINPGDIVSVDFLETDESRVPVEKIEVVGIKLKKSQIQVEYETQRAASKKIEDAISDSQKAEREWNSLSPEEKRNLMNR